MWLWLLRNWRLLAIGALGLVIAGQAIVIRIARADTKVAEVERDAAVGTARELARLVARAEAFARKEAAANDSAAQAYRTALLQRQTFATALESVLAKEGAANAELGACLSMPLPSSVRDALP
jgi:predicted component of type VI protein secretion system